MRATSSSRTAFLRDRSFGTARSALQLDAQAVELALAVAGEEERRLAQRLRRERPRVDRRAAGLLRPLDERDALAEVRGLRRALLAGGAAAEDDQIVVVAAHADDATARGRRDRLRFNPTPLAPRPAGRAGGT